MITFTKKEAYSVFIWTLIAGMFAGYALGLVHFASWKSVEFEQEQSYYAE